MDAKKIALLIAALLVAGATAFMAKSMFAADAAPTAAAAPMPVKNDGPEIMVATRTLPVGTIIGADSFRYQPWPEELIENAYYEKGDADPASLAGTVVRAPISAGQPLTKGSLVQPGDRGFLAAALGPGMRAITIDISSNMGNSGFVFPGDRIDLVLTSELANSSGDGGPALRTAETIIRNLRVLAKNDKVSAENADGKREIVGGGIITLEVTPKIAEKIAVARKMGDLSVVLRSIADNTAELEKAIASGTVKVPANGDVKAEKEMLVQVASRPSDTDTTYVVGADVSRFQRRSIPRPQAAPRSTPSSAPAAAAPPSYDRPVPTGPVVKVARGNTVTEVTLGGK
jgi:pilus assembly protein CpaB